MRYSLLVIAFTTENYVWTGVIVGVFLTFVFQVLDGMGSMDYKNKKSHRAISAGVESFSAIVGAIMFVGFAGACLWLFFARW